MNIKRNLYGIFWPLKSVNEETNKKKSRKKMTVTNNNSPRRIEETTEEKKMKSTDYKHVHSHANTKEINIMKMHMFSCCSRCFFLTFFSHLRIFFFLFSFPFRSSSIYLKQQQLAHIFWYLGRIHGSQCFLWFFFLLLLLRSRGNLEWMLFFVSSVCVWWFFFLSSLYSWCLSSVFPPMLFTSKIK